MLVEALLSALANLVVLVVLPFGGYSAFQKWLRKRTFREIRERAGLRLGEPRYLVHSAAFAVLSVAAFLLWRPPVEVLAREGSASRDFAGAALGVAIPSALLYGVIKTGFCEELLFRGLIAGSLGRRLSLAWANLWQALIFLLPHFFVLLVMPELWPLLPVVFVSSLFLGWVRLRSGSILGPWLIHAAANVTTCLYVAVRSAA